MVNLIKYIKLKRNFIASCLEFLAMIMVLVPLLTVYIGKLIVDDYQYEINYSVLFRTITFIVVLGSAVVFKYSRQFGLYGLANKNSFVVSLFSTFFMVTSFLICLLILWKRSIFDINIIKSITVLAFLYILIHVWSVFKKVFEFKHNKIVVNSVLILLVGLSLFLPLQTSKYLNSESYPNKDEIDFLKSKIHQRNITKSIYSQITLNQDENRVVDQNIQLMRLGRNKGNIGFYNKKDTNYGSEFEWQLSRKNLSALCLLGRYQGFSVEYKNVNECINAINADVSKAEMVLQKVNFINNDISYEVDKVLVDNDLNSRSLSTFSDVQNHLNVMLIRGGVFHHYNSIAQTINASDDIKGYFSNQYGFGPLVIVHIISKAFKLTTFDAIYLSIFIVNLLIFLLLIFVTKKDDSAYLLWLGFITSIFVTYALSNILAPFLYFIRFLPTVLLCLYLYKTRQDAEIFEDKLNLVFWVICIFLISLYNFEYGVLTLLAIFVASWYCGKRKISFLSLFGILLAFIPKMLVVSNQTINTNYLAYLGGVGMDGSIGIVTLLFFISALVILFWQGRYIEYQNKKNFNLTLITLIFLFLCFKILWNGGANHIGPQFLLLAMIVSMMQKDIDSKHGNSNSLIKIHLFSTFVILVIACVLSFKFFCNKKYENVEYTTNRVSKFFLVSKNLNDKINAFEEIYQPNDLLISPIDNVLSMYVAHSLTIPYPDLSTNDNVPKDESLIVDAYINKRNSRVIVDKFAIDDQHVQEIESNFLGFSNNLNGYVKGYSENHIKLKRIYSRLVDFGYSQCETYNYFIVLCPPEKPLSKIQNTQK